MSEKTKEWYEKERYEKLHDDHMFQFCLDRAIKMYISYHQCWLAVPARRRAKLLLCAIKDIAAARSLALHFVCMGEWAFLGCLESFLDSELLNLLDEV